ncbi:hypothetical protein FNV43_RR22509 [Rhamnella rubrinervis]|uniref:Uncharacterized protein n=1 Tax=Rhamnella rubrinervis TaxID=2594499 RepID=A0A8K0DX92_9ROSA|nr:hypothetical protein FNV43_RR22509 [Rhamnella rubrinervis]
MVRYWGSDPQMVDLGDLTRFDPQLSILGIRLDSTLKWSILGSDQIRPSVGWIQLSNGRIRLSNGQI